MTDKYYTPNWLADEIAGALPDLVGSVVDFASGRGALLDAVERRFGDAVTMHATDRDPRSLQYLRQARAHWRVGKMDLLSTASRAASRFWSDGSLVYDSVVLNPPFSYRGGAAHKITDGRGHEYRTTPAVAFVAYALQRVALGGTIVVLLPTSAIYSDRDAALWNNWLAQYEIDLLATYDRNVFPGAFTRTTLVRIAKRPVVPPGKAVFRSVALSAHASNDLCICLEMIRGRVAVHSMRTANWKGSSPFVHTTNLVDARVVPARWHRGPTSLGTVGPLLLLPRVGRPSPSKLSLYMSTDPIVLSDCVIGLRLPFGENLEALRMLMIANWELVQDLYESSCAPYVTLRRLGAALESMGYGVTHSAAGASPRDCGCRADPDAAGSAESKDTSRRVA